MANPLGRSALWWTIWSQKNWLKALLLNEDWNADSTPIANHPKWSNFVIESVQKIHMALILCGNVEIQHRVNAHHALPNKRNQVAFAQGHEIGHWAGSQGHEFCHQEEHHPLQPTPRSAASADNCKRFGCKHFAALKFTDLVKKKKTNPAPAIAISIASCWDVLNNGTQPISQANTSHVMLEGSQSQPRTHRA